MSTLIRICGGAIIASGCALLLKESSKSASACAAIIGLAVLMGSVLTELFSVISPLKEMLGQSGALDYASIMLKGLGVGITVKLTCDICCDMGEKGISDCVELAGRAEILILCLPVLTKMLSSVKELLS